ncbi:hypothetical protein DVH24_011573 [Malus domestica]|uniref:Transmembrane protein n=1 Tax=Malus domestica TaxID=3750 RepID=A0A498JTQ7_MALDO|nr:hypothetical protein DVH24_011573 [Malus domestica]
MNFRFCPRPFFFYCNFAPFACCQTENICFAVKRRTKWDAWVFPASSLCLFDSLFILSTASILLSQFHSLLNFFLSRFRCFLSTASIFLQLAAASSIKPYKSFCCFWAPSFLSLLLAFPNLESSSFPRKRNLKSTTQNSVIVAQRSFPISLRSPLRALQSLLRHLFLRAFSVISSPATLLQIFPIEKTQIIIIYSSSPQLWSSVRIFLAKSLEQGKGKMRETRFLNHRFANSYRGAIIFGWLVRVLETFMFFAFYGNEKKEENIDLNCNFQFFTLLILKSLFCRQMADILHSQLFNN